LTHLEDVYQDVILKLVACINKADRKKISKITIRMMDRNKVKGARPEPPDHFAVSYEIIPPKETKFILTSIKIEQEVLKDK
jgi:hypothetical protein